MGKKPTSGREFEIYYARVLLSEARARRDSSRWFSAFLLACAGKARRRAMEATPRDLFSTLPMETV